LISLKNGNWKCLIIGVLIFPISGINFH